MNNIIFVLSLLALSLSQTKADCNKACTFIFNPVCGSDGEVHANFCVFLGAQCEAEKAGSSLYLAGLPNDTSDCADTYANLTPDKCKIDCPRGGQDQVCGSDGVTYDDRCSFEVARCQLKLNNVELKIVTC